MLKILQSKQPHGRSSSSLSSYRLIFFLSLTTDLCGFGRFQMTRQLFLSFNLNQIHASKSVSISNSINNLCIVDAAALTHRTTIYFVAVPFAVHCTCIDHTAGPDSDPYVSQSYIVLGKAAKKRKRKKRDTTRVGIALQTHRYIHYSIYRNSVRQTHMPFGLCALYKYMRWQLTC